MIWMHWACLFSAHRYYYRNHRIELVSNDNLERDAWNLTEAYIRDL